MVRRLMVFGAAATLAAALVPGAAGATPATDTENHKVTICHVTESTKKPYVVITVDVAAYDAHMQHYSDKNEMGDVDFVDGECREYDGIVGGGDYEG